jgi:hypothetical protein
MPLSTSDIAILSRLLDEALAMQAAEREAWFAALPPEQQRHVPALREMLAQETGLDTDHPLDSPILGGRRPGWHLRCVWIKQGDTPQHRSSSI